MKIYIKLWLTALFWGGAFIAGKHTAETLESSSIAFLRFAMASVLLLGLTWKREGRLPKPNRSQVVTLILLGLTGIFAYNFMFFKGLRLIEAGRASLIIATCPAFIALSSAILFKEWLGGIRLTGVLLSVCGAAVVVSKGELGGILHGGVGRGELLILGCVLSWVAYSLMGKTIMQALSPLVAVSYTVVIGTVALFVVAVSENLGADVAAASWVDWLAIVYMAVFATVGGFVWFYEGISRIGVTRAGLFINFVPVFAVLLAFLILDEPLTWSLGVGAALVLFGVFLTNRRPSDPMKTPS